MSNFMIELNLALHNAKVICRQAAPTCKKQLVQQTQLIVKP